MSEPVLDCLVIGHHEIGVARYNQLIRLLYGRGSKNFQETGKYNLSNVRCEDGAYSPAQIYNLVTRGDGERKEIADTFSLTVAYLGTFLHRHGFTFEYANTFHRPEDRQKLDQLLTSGRVRTVAITTTYYLNPIPLLDIMRFVRARAPDAAIIVGGPFIRNQVRLLPSDKLDRIFATVGADYYIDSSEGEATLAELVGAIKRGDPVDGVPNLFVPTPEGYRATPKRTEANDISANGVEWGLFRDDLRDIVNIRTSKSCPFRCSFCSFPGASGKYFVMDLDAVERELDALHAINPDLGLDIIDDTFNIPPIRFRELLGMMIRKNYRFRWYAFYKAQLADREVTRLMRDAGCVQVFAGCESGSQTILDNLVKDSRVERYDAAFEYLHEFGLLSIASFIVGFPGETEETWAETMRFIERARPTFFRTRLWWYDRTAPVHADGERFGLTGDGYEWTHATMDSTAAQRLAERMMREITGSIHATDYPIPFELIVKGVPPDTARQFMARFRDHMHAGIDVEGRIVPKSVMIEDFSRILAPNSEPAPQLAVGE